MRYECEVEAVLAVSVYGPVPAIPTFPLPGRVDKAGSASVIDAESAVNTVVIDNVLVTLDESKPEPEAVNTVVVAAVSVSLQNFT
jgi:hypothetical protein